MSKSLLQALDEEFGLGPDQALDERRSSERRSCVAPVVLVPGDGPEVRREEARRDGIAVDISEGGMRVVSRSLGSASWVQVRIPRRAGGWIVLEGEVVRQRELRDGYRELGLRLDRRAT